MNKHRMTRNFTSGTFTPVPISSLSREALEDHYETLSRRVDSLLGNLRGPAPYVRTLEDRFAAIEHAIARLEQTAEALSARLTKLENQPSVMRDSRLDIIGPGRVP